MSMVIERSLVRKESTAGSGPGGHIYDANAADLVMLSALFRSSSKNTKEGDDRIAWLHSQLIGKEVEFDTPFGKRGLTYADHTASGRGLRYIENYIAQQVLPFYGNTHTTDSFVGSKTSKMVDEATEYIKRCMGAGPDDAIIFCGAGTTACIKRLQEVMGITVPSIMRERLLKTLSNDERWVVFIGPYEHHSNILSWRQSSAQVVEIGMDRDGLIDMEELERELRSPRFASRPMLGSFSACSNVTGILTDTRAIARLLHEHGAFACFDFAASGPYVEIDMKAGDIAGYDAVFLSPHKFIGGPGTPGILLMNKALYQLGSSPPSTCGGGTVDYVNGFSEDDTIYYEDVEERENAGTPPITQKIRAALTFWLKEYIGHDLIDLYETVYIETALRRLLPNPNICVLGNTTVKRLPILSFLIYPSPSGGLHSKKPLHGRFVASLFNDLFGVQARGGCACAGPYGHYLLGVDKPLSQGIRSVIGKGYNGLKPGWTRVSFSYYMTKEEFAFVLACIEFIANYGHRFIPLYDFDWASGDWSFRKKAFKYLLMKEQLSIAARDLSTQDSMSISSVAKADQVIKSYVQHSGKDNWKVNGVAQRSMAYLESARQVALSLPDNPTPVTLPRGVDPNMVLFMI